MASDNLTGDVKPLFSAEMPTVQGDTTDEGLKKDIRWRISSPATLRRRAVQMVNDYRLDENADPQRFRNFMFGMRVILDVLKAEKECQIEERISQLEHDFHEMVANAN